VRPGFSIFCDKLVTMEQTVSRLLRFHQQNRLLTHLLFWGVVYGLGWVEMLFNSGLTPAQSGKEIAWLMLNRIPMAYLLVYVLVLRLFQKARQWLAILYFLVGCYGLYVVSSVLDSYIFAPNDGKKVLLWLQLSDFSFFFQNYLLSHLGAGVFVLLVKLLIGQAEGQRKALTLEKQKAELELKLLKAQLNPHFLFNTLNNIYALSLLQSPQTPEAIARLSEILDYVLYRCNTDRLPLSSEIAFIENYMALEKLRYGDRLEVVLIKKLPHDLPIAPMILLTLVENAFKHGASEDTGTPRIEVDLATTNSQIICQVSNQYNENQTDRQGGKIGLANIRQQLELLYGPHYDLRTEANEGIFKVFLQINNAHRGSQNR
jgi:Histidine kinase